MAKIDFGSEHAFYDERPRVLFCGMDFTSNFSLRKGLFHGIEFVDCNISKGSFSLCEPPEGRIKLFNERKKEKNKEKNYAELSELYRQLKVNFSNEKNWDMEAKSYRSEMVMKKKAYFKDAKEGWFIITLPSTFEWLIYSLYDGLSGFNQSVVRPFLLLFVSSLVVFPTYYMACGSTEANAMKKSISAMMPYFFKAEPFLVYPNWWIKSFQTVFSTILIAFILTALRKRFKQ